MVVGIAGIWMPPYLGTDTKPLPAGWLPAGSAATAAEAGVAAEGGTKASEGGEGGEWVHEESYEAARKVAEQLEASQVGR